MFIQQLKFNIITKMDHLSPFTHQQIFQFESLAPPQFQQAILTRSKSSLALSQFIQQLYSFATENSWDLTKKCGLLNLSLKILTDLIKSNSKQDFVDMIKKETEMAGRRDGNYKQIFSEADINSIRVLLKEQLLPYFELYRIIFDNHFHFRLQTNQKDAVSVYKEQEILAGSPVQVENIPALQEYLGIRLPKEQKKDVKKK